MYKHCTLQAEFEDFFLPFGGKLPSNNRWVIMAKMIPWCRIEAPYAKHFASSGMGAPALSARVALGALIIKEKLGASDEETVEQIKENPFLQYFLGYGHFEHEAPFDPSMMVHFRKRFSAETLAEINACVVGIEEEETSSEKGTPTDPSCPEVPQGESEPEESTNTPPGKTHDRCNLCTGRHTLSHRFELAQRGA